MSAVSVAQRVVGLRDALRFSPSDSVVSRPPARLGGEPEWFVAGVSFPSLDTAMAFWRLLRDAAVPDQAPEPVVPDALDTFLDRLEHHIDAKAFLAVAADNPTAGDSPMLQRLQDRTVEHRMELRSALRELLRTPA